ncbi:hypothetical protein KGM_206639 [Danaus plexippus plexippus]|uniref:Uncharacterized protein n=1 Tax=Danaus plexippus plexippus TaxID=278856 RepID=A0A212FCB1_DANPL|nr:hypothetical protein KGM_206639 [Danaus plexippus plexippus]
MRPSQEQEPRHDAVLLSAYLFKLGDYPLYTLHDNYANVVCDRQTARRVKSTSTRHIRD